MESSITKTEKQIIDKEEIKARFVYKDESCGKERSYELSKKTMSSMETRLTLDRIERRCKNFTNKLEEIETKTSSIERTLNDLATRRR